MFRVQYCHSSCLINVAYLPPLIVYNCFQPVKLWWPHGVGDPVLYDMQVIWVAGDDTTKRDVRFGFRTVQLVQDPIPGSQG